MLIKVPLMAKLVCWSVMHTSLLAGGDTDIAHSDWVFMGLWLFSLTLIIMNLSAFGIRSRWEYPEADLLAAGRKVQA
jgi:hypothetical protein